MDQNQLSNQVQSNVNTNFENNIPDKYKPISMWGYVGYELLFSIPCLGFILLLVFAFGGTANINLRNFARSYLCFIIIVIILTLISVAVAGMTFIGALS